MKKITLEQAHKLLETLDKSMPNDFTTLTVAYSKNTDTYYVKWFDDAQKAAYDNGVSRSTPAAAKFAYSFEPRPSYSAIWFNENDKGEFEATCQQLDADEIRKISISGETLTLLDQA